MNAPLEGFSVERRSDGKLDIKGLNIWSAVKGVVGYGSPAEGDTFTRDDLDAMVQAHQEVGDRLRPRLYAGHPLNTTLKMLARPKGEIKRLYREGDFLRADLEGVDPDFWQKATADGARLSPDMKLGHRDQRTGKHYPLSIVGVGVLGSVQPANQLLPALDEYVVNHYADAAQQRAYGEPDSLRSYAGPTLRPEMALASPWQPVLEALRRHSDKE